MISCGDNMEPEPEVVSFDPLIGISTRNFNQNIAGADVVRSIIIHAPEPFVENKTYPILIALHGTGERSDTWVNKLGQLVSNGEFIGVYAQAHENSWNVTKTQLAANDVEFIRSILLDLSPIPNVDFSRKYLLGYDEGAIMVNQLALETKVFNAAAILGAQLSDTQIPSTDTEPISIMQINGLNDEVIPYEGGPGLRELNYIAAEESLKLWSVAFGCTSDPSVDLLGDNTLISYSTCSNGKELQLLKIQDADHNLDGVTSLNIYNIAWEFLKKY